MEIVRELQRYGAYIIPQYNYAENDDFKGPRMHGEGDELVLPDLDVCRNRVRIWVEVKTKTIADLHYKTGDYVHGFNRKHYEHYRQVEAESGNEVWVVFIGRTSREVLCGRLTKIPLHHIYTGDKMGPNGMVFFNVKDLHSLPTLINRLYNGDIP